MAAPQPDLPKSAGNSERILSLEIEIEEIQKSWPAHSVPPAMLLRLEALEEALAEARQQERG